MKIEKWNPCVKAFTILVSVILLSFSYVIQLNILVFGISLFFLFFFSDAKIKHILSILAPAMIAAFGLFMMGLYYARGNSITSVEMESLSAVPYTVRAAMSQNLETALQLSTRMLAYAGMGILFALSTDGELFIYSLMHQCRLSPKFAYGILAAFHLMPNMVREYQNVRVAFRVRGVHAGVLSLKPIFTMLVNSVRWSESVSMAMESKGFCPESPRTCYCVPKIHWYDLLGCILVLSGIVLGMIYLK